MQNLEEARQRIAQQKALLEEARANYDRVIGSARAGRFTGRELGGCSLGDVGKREAPLPEELACQRTVLEYEFQVNASGDSH